MTRMTLVVFPDGKMLLTTDQSMDRAAAEQVREQFKRWLSLRDPVAVIAETDVVRVESIELDDE